MITHPMITRSKKKQMNISSSNERQINIASSSKMDIEIPLQKSDHNKPFKNMTESQDNYYYSQQICVMRDISMEKYYIDSMNFNESNKSEYLQELYDGGCALINCGIIIKMNNDFQLDSNFGDYLNWQFNENNVINNCNYLRKMGHIRYV